MSDSSTNTNYPTLARNALFAGILGLAIAGFGLVNGVSSGDERPLFSWLIGISYWLSIGIGMLFILQIFYLFDAGWGTVIRRQYEHAIGGFRWIALIFLPLVAVAHGLLGDDPGILWKWMNLAGETSHGTVADDPLYINKQAFLNLEFFTLRYVLYFAIWIGLSALYRKYSYNMDTDGQIGHAHAARKLCTIGVIVSALSATFAAFDWYMSIEYHWFSTMYGVWFFAESMRSGFAATAVMLYILSTRGYLKGIINTTHFYYVGCAMLAFTVFWAYISFSQYFLIYSANIPEETFWFFLREMTPGEVKNNWWCVSLFLVFGQFVIPFLLLLWNSNKVIPKRLAMIGAWMLFTHLVDMYWNILPGKVYTDHVATYRQFNLSEIGYDIAMLVGVGGIVVWSFLKDAARHKAIPIRDPRILESVHAHE